VEAVRKVKGVKGVINLITLKPRVTPSEIKAKIEEAFRRNAEIDAQQSPASGDEKNLSVMVAAEDGCSAGGRRGASAFLNPVVRGERPRTASS
jgi:hypothetical protein